MILKLSTSNRRSLLCTCACRAWSLNVFQFVVALLKNFPTSSNSLKNAMNIKATIIKAQHFHSGKVKMKLETRRREITIKEGNQVRLSAD